MSRSKFIMTRLERETLAGAKPPPSFDYRSA